MAPQSPRVNLRIVPLSALRPHEETVASMSEAVLRSLIRDGFQRDPIAVDSETMTVLDGSHRVEALSKAGAKSALAWVLEYGDPNVQLFRWYRLVRSPGEDLPERILKELGLTLLGQAERARSDGRLRIIRRGRAFGHGRSALVEELRTMRTFDRMVAESGFEVEFVDEASATNVHLKGDDLFLVPPAISKDDVIAAAAAGRLFPPKSTLHVFPFRPLGVNYPIDDLREGRDVIEVLLASRRPRMVESRGAYGRRGYREALVVFD